MNLWRATLGRLFAQHRARMEAIVARRVRDRDVAADIVQDVFANVLQSGGRGSPEADTRLLYAAARNAAIDRSLMSARRRRLLGRVLPEQIAAPQPESGAEIEGREAVAALDRALGELSPRARTIFLMHRIDGAPHAEIAAAMEISVSAVEKSLARTLRHCQERLKPHREPR
ncbi:RNA polymerase sigma factor [Methylocella sp.]|uniref:RNA polymerase sigma factor n=1 Tax=Methylocella sp. TaxID=1978226 RepID=UPI003783E578